MIYLVNYATKDMAISQDKCSDSSLKYGVDKVFNYTPENIDCWFFKTNKDILTQERGAGYWLWKPYVIMKAFNYWAIKEGDIIIYADAGVEFVGDVNKIIEKMDDDIFLFGNMYNHVDWCKWDVINCINKNDYMDSSYNLIQKKQAQASVIFFRVSKRSKDFIREWLAYCQIPGLIDDSPSKLPNYPTFAEHRHDQAIITCLAIKYNIPLHWWPAMYSDGAFTYEKGHYKDSYPVIFHHTRKRNHEH